jgi:dTDP-4-amino-4,6-dideoxygalactose transaminase
MPAYPRHSVNLSAGCYSALAKTALSGKVLQGPEVEQFEREFAKYIDIPYAIGVSSGRAALYLALKALGFEEGDEIIMPAYTFHIVPLVIHACGLKPVFIDVEPDSYNIDISQIEKHITPKTKAISAVHMYGQPCELDPILELAQKHNLIMIEDCAHALGAEYKGKKIGSFGDLGLFTFAMAKNMPCFGGGMITLKDRALYEKLLGQIKLPESSRRTSLWKEVVGTTVNYIATLPGIFPLLTFQAMRLLSSKESFAFDQESGQETITSSQIQVTFPTRLTNLQAAVGLHQLTRIDDINAQVSRNAQIYNQELKGLPGLKTPEVSEGRTHTYLYYRLEVERLQELRAKIFPKGIDTRPDDMSDCTTLPPFRDQVLDVPVANRLPRTILEIPNNPNMNEKDVRYVANCIKDAIQRL